MSKPIVIIRYNAERLVLGNGVNNTTQMVDINRLFEDRFPDYLTFAYPEYIDDLFEFQVFHEKDFTPIQYEELKTLITDAIEQQKHKI